MRFSVIIPTLNEADHIADAIASSRAAGPCEVVVVDGGSQDDTVARARAAKADRIRQTDPGRGGQQNAGAAEARGDVLLFLHADCRLESGSLARIEAELTDAHTVAGCLRQRIPLPGLRYRLLEQGNQLRARSLGWAYGDQAIFVRRAAFAQVGGFPDEPIMEDLLIMKRLKRVGRITVVSSCHVRVSPRRWQQTGLVRQTLRNWMLLTLAHCGVSPRRLMRFYPHVR